MSKSNGNEAKYFKFGELPMDLAVTKRPETDEGADSRKEVSVPTVTLPCLDEPFLEDSRAQEVAAKIRREAEKIGAWVATAVPKIEQADSLPREIVEQIGRQKSIESAKETLSQLLFGETQLPAYRRAARLAYMLSLLSCDKTMEEAKILINRLIREKLLFEARQGQIRFGFRLRLHVPDDSFFSEEEIFQVATGVNSLFQRAEAKGEAEQARKAKALWAKSEMSVLEMAEGDRTGMCTMFIPPEIKEDRVFPSGTLLVECRNENGIICIYPVDASGKPNFRSPIERIKELEVFLNALSLKGDRPPRLTTFDQERTGKLQLFWYSIKRAIRHAAEEAERNKLKAQYAQKATLSMEEFLLEGKTGICLVSICGTWKPEGKKEIHDLFFLIERITEGENVGLRLLEVPDHVPTDFFISCQEKTFNDGKNGFVGIGQPLQNVLRAAFKQIRHSMQVKEARD